MIVITIMQNMHNMHNSNNYYAYFAQGRSFTYAMTFWKHVIARNARMNLHFNFSAHSARGITTVCTRKMCNDRMFLGLVSNFV